MMRGRNLMLLVGGIAIALLVVVIFAPNASSNPDGLERIAVNEGFSDKATPAPFGLLSDYAIPGVENETAATILAGVTGVSVVTAITIGIGWLLRRRERITRTHPNSPRRV